MNTPFPLYGLTIQNKYSIHLSGFPSDRSLSVYLMTLGSSRGSPSHASRLLSSITIDPSGDNEVSGWLYEHGKFPSFTN